MVVFFFFHHKQNALPRKPKPCEFSQLLQQQQQEEEDDDLGFVFCRRWERERVRDRDKPKNLKSSCDIP
ncbi:unnamed protein product [Sphagnum balticum]